MCKGSGVACVICMVDRGIAKKISVSSCSYPFVVITWTTRLLKWWTQTVQKLCMHNRLESDVCITSWLYVHAKLCQDVVLVLQKLLFHNNWVAGTHLPLFTRSNHLYQGLSVYIFGIIVLNLFDDNTLSQMWRNVGFFDETGLKLKKFMLYTCVTHVLLK